MAPLTSHAPLPRIDVARHAVNKEQRPASVAAGVAPGARAPPASSSTGRSRVVAAGRPARGGYACSRASTSGAAPRAPKISARRRLTSGPCRPARRSRVWRGGREPAAPQRSSLAGVVGVLDSTPTRPAHIRGHARRRRREDRDHHRRRPLDRALGRALREVAAAATRAPQAGREALREVGARLENLAAEVVQVRGKDELARAPAQREAAAGRHYRGLAAASAALAESIRAKRAELETAALQVEELQRAIAMREAFLADPANARVAVHGVGQLRALLGLAAAAAAAVTI